MVFRFLALFLLAVPAAGLAGPVSEAAMRRHIEILASDDFEGRAPGTEGERKTIAYVAAAMRAAGLEPAGVDGGWFQPVELVTRGPSRQRASFRSGRRRIDLGGDKLLLRGDRADERLVRAPVYFAGHGAVFPDKGIDQLAGADLAGAVVLILYDSPAVAGFPDYPQRVRAAAERGAAAVIGIVGAEISWPSIREAYREAGPRLAIETRARIQGTLSQAGAMRLAEAAGTSLATLLDETPGPAFRPVRLDLKATMAVATDVRRQLSNNVVGRLPGAGRTGESLLFLGHWDHLGLCRGEGEADRICNGAVDNASGIAALLEIARELAAGPRPQRDILFLATTAEESGLLGAEYFASRPPVPLRSIVAALNLDTVAISPRGRPVAVIGRGVEPLDRLIAETAAGQGRQLDSDHEADDFVDRQDGWALARAGIPALMVGGSFSDMAELGTFLSGAYHGPEDEAGPALELGGAAEDADLLIALARKLADPARYRRPARGQPN